MNQVKECPSCGEPIHSGKNPFHCSNQQHIVRDLAYQAFTGCRVTGQYFGQPFSGIVTGRSWDTIDPHTIFVWIKLDEPLTKNGKSREGICLEYNSMDTLSDCNFIDWIDPDTYPNK